MAMHGGEGHVPGYTPFRKEGWGIAAFICVLAVALFVGAFAIHRATFNDPFDPLSPSKGRPEAAHAAPGDGAHGPSGDHAPAAGGH